jgi:hypothetical protein
MKSGFKKVDNSGKSAPIPSHRAQTRIVCTSLSFYLNLFLHGSNLADCISIHFCTVPTLLIVFYMIIALLLSYMLPSGNFFRMPTMQEHNLMRIQKNWMYKHYILWNAEWPMAVCQ